MPYGSDNTEDLTQKLLERTTPYPASGGHWMPSLRYVKLIAAYIGVLLKRLVSPVWRWN
jgi:hypothetical protein